MRCSYGRVFDVIVDLRPDSPTYRNQKHLELSGDTQVTLYVPAGCAHGFQALTDPADVSYRIDRPHDPAEDVAIAFDDPELAIPWPLPPALHVRTGPAGADAGGRARKDLETMDFTRSREANKRLHDMVPGGAHTYAKGEDQYPEGMAPVISHGRGAHVWDVDGNEFIEYGSGLRSVSLGHAHPRVTRGRARPARAGQQLRAARAPSRSRRPPGSWPPCRPRRWSSSRRTARTSRPPRCGSRGRRPAARLVAICRDQPFFSTDDWFIGTTAMSAGIPSRPRT